MSLLRRKFSRSLEQRISLFAEDDGAMVIIWLLAILAGVGVGLLRVLLEEHALRSDRESSSGV